MERKNTGYAIIPMDEYIALFTEIGDLRKENAGLKAELDTTKRFLSEATMKLDRLQHKVDLDDYFSGKMG